LGQRPKPNQTKPNQPTLKTTTKKAVALTIKHFSVWFLIVKTKLQTLHSMIWRWLISEVKWRSLERTWLCGGRCVVMRKKKKLEWSLISAAFGFLPFIYTQDPKYIFLLLLGKKTASTPPWCCIFSKHILHFFPVHSQLCGKKSWSVFTSSGLYPSCSSSWGEIWATYIPNE
jgi:hypothetical protein